jgi:hypothetical protein
MLYTCILLVKCLVDRLDCEDYLFSYGLIRIPKRRFPLYFFSTMLCESSSLMGLGWILLIFCFGFTLYSENAVWVLILCFLTIIFFVKIGLFLFSTINCVRSKFFFSLNNLSCSSYLTRILEKVLFVLVLVGRRI